jgi:hypothetical protein
MREDKMPSTIEQTEQELRDAKAALDAAKADHEAVLEPASAKYKAVHDAAGVGYKATMDAAMAEYKAAIEPTKALLEAARKAFLKANEKDFICRHGINEDLPIYTRIRILRGYVDWLIDESDMFHHKRPIGDLHSELMNAIEKNRTWFEEALDEEALDEEPSEADASQDNLAQRAMPKE